MFGNAIKIDTFRSVVARLWVHLCFIDYILSSRNKESNDLVYTRYFPHYGGHRRSYIGLSLTSGRFRQVGS